MTSRVRPRYSERIREWIHDVVRHMQAFDVAPQLYWYDSSSIVDRFIRKCRKPRRSSERNCISGVNPNLANQAVRIGQ
jgi:hypothetical protein